MLDDRPPRNPHRWHEYNRTDCVDASYLFHSYCRPDWFGGLTGIYDPDCGQGTTLAVPRNFSMLPKQLKALNYSTVAIGKWYSSPTSSARDNAVNQLCGAGIWACSLPLCCPLAGDLIASSATTAVP